MNTLEAQITALGDQQAASFRTVMAAVSFEDEMHLVVTLLQMVGRDFSGSAKALAAIAATDPLVARFITAAAVSALCQDLAARKLADITPESHP